MDDASVNSPLDRLRRLAIGSSGSPRRHHRNHSITNGSSPQNVTETVMNTQRRARRSGRPRTAWFDELAYGRRSREVAIESLEEPVTGTDESSSSTESGSDSASRPVTSTWYHTVLGNSVSTPSRMRSPLSVRPSTSGSRVRSGRHQHMQNSRSAIYSHNMPNHDQSNAATNRDMDRVTEVNRSEDFDMHETRQRGFWTNQQRHVSDSNAGMYASPEEEGMNDQPEPVQVANMHALSGEEEMNNQSEPAQAPNITSIESSDPMSVLVHRLDFIQQSSLDVVREGMNKITDHIQNVLPLTGGVPGNSIPVVSRSANRIKRTGFPIRRSNETRHRQENIRDYLKRLLARTTSPIVEAAEARAFHMRWDREGAPPCCTVYNFQIDLNGPPRSSWNRSASQVFADAYCDFYQVPRQMQREARVDVAARFLTRIKALKSKHRAATLTHSEKMRVLQLCRRRTRKTNLFHRRLEAAEQHPHLHQHRDILQRLGIDGMSSDESDYEEVPTNPPAAMRAPRYYVLSPRWRANSLSDWLETFDVVYNIMRRESPGRRGAYARRRLQNSTTVTYSQSRSFVPQLPINAYDMTWLSGRRDVPFSILPTDRYNFAHSPEVISYMRGTVLELPQDR